MGRRSEMQTEFAVSNGRGWKSVSTVDANPAHWLGFDHWADWCRRMKEKAANRPYETKRYLVGAMEAGAIRVDGDRVVIADGKTKRVMLLSYINSNEIHCGKLFWEAAGIAQVGLDVWRWYKDPTPEETVTKLKEALETWLTDLWFNYAKDAAKPSGFHLFSIG